MMGETTDDLDAPITKTTTGVVVLSRRHHVIERKLKPAKTQAQIGKSACDQCRYCTEYCPRFLLGYAVEPHQVMRSLAFTPPAQSIGTSGRRCAARAACARSTPARKNFSPRKPATIPKPRCARPT